MTLSAAQLQTLKTDIAANTNTVTIGGTPFQIKNLGVDDRSAEAAQKVAAWYNLLASPAYLAWGNAVALKVIRAATDISKFTPADAVPASGSTVQATNDAMLYQNRALACQLKQANAFYLVQGEGTVNCSSQQFRQSFSDCMTLIPSGVSGANQNAGWGVAASPGAIKTAMQINITNGAKLFSGQAAGTGATGVTSTDQRGSATNPDALGVNANGDAITALTSQDIFDAWAS